MNNPLLACSNLHTFYDRSHILHGINFHINPGETLALMGRNGMGKSTLLKSLLGITPIQQGHVNLRDRDVTRVPTYQRMQMGIAYVPEGRGIFSNLSVRENLLMPARAGFNGQRAWTLDRVLATFPRLADRLHHGGGQLSGGEQQMLTIGRALMTNPDLLILDEATEGLAPIIAQEIWRMVKEIRQSKIATIIVDKNHASLTHIAERAMILVKGMVVFTGSSESLRQNPKIIQQHLGIS